MKLLNEELDNVYQQKNLKPWLWNEQEGELQTFNIRKGLC